MPHRTVTGIHHITAIASDPQRTVDFYSTVLGLRLVKCSVNFDAPGTYHLYFGDDVGAPGSIMTFFPWPGASRGVIGNGQVSGTAFAVSPESLDYWATLSEECHQHTAELLKRLGYTEGGGEGNRFRYTIAGRPASVVDVLCSPDGEGGWLGAGTVHHIAFRTPDDAQQRAWRHNLAGCGHNVTPVIDRRYFHSIYFREPGGVLFEIATDPPGLLIDEPQDHLGEKLMLPPWLELRRSELERHLPPLSLIRRMEASQHG
jgi:glyoxalase family protein